MSAELTDTQGDFLIKYVLYLPTGSGEQDRDAETPRPDFSGFVAAWPPARRDWQTASDTVDTQIGQLQGKLKSSDDDELHMIAETGLNAVTGNHRVRVMAAVMEIDASAGEPSSAVLDRAVGAISAFAAHLSSDPRVKACDNNPFGVSMSVATTLRAGLSALARAIKAAPRT